MEAAQKRADPGETLLLEEERRPGARVLVGSGAVGDDEAFAAGWGWTGGAAPAGAASRNGRRSRDRSIGKNLLRLPSSLSSIAPARHVRPRRRCFQQALGDDGQQALVEERPGEGLGEIPCVA